MNVLSLSDLYLEQLKDLYSSQKQIENAAPRMIDAASSEELVRALETHREHTATRQTRIQEIAQRHDAEAAGHTCKGTTGLIKEAVGFLDEHGGSDPAVVDAGIITHAQRLLHYELAGFGTLNTYARELGDDSAACFFREVLDATYEADRALTALAQNTINAKAEA